MFENTSATVVYGMQQCWAEPKVSGSVRFGSEPVPKKNRLETIPVGSFDDRFGTGSKRTGLGIFDQISPRLLIVKRRTERQIGSLCAPMHNNKASG